MVKQLSDISDASNGRVLRDLVASGVQFICRGVSGIINYTLKI
jgi:hypothetical protein